MLDSILFLLLSLGSGAWMFLHHFNNCTYYMLLHFVFILSLFYSYFYFYFYLYFYFYGYTHGCFCTVSTIVYIVCYCTYFIPIVLVFLFLLLILFSIFIFIFIFLSIYFYFYSFTLFVFLCLFIFSAHSVSLLFWLIFHFYTILLYTIDYNPGDDNIAVLLTGHLFGLMTCWAARPLLDNDPRRTGINAWMACACLFFM